MNVETLQFALSVSGGLLLITITILGVFLKGILTQNKDMGEKINAILQVNGIVNEKVKTHEQQISFMNAKMVDNADKWADLFKEYNLQKR